MTCQLYRHFAVDGSLLYVGISNNALARAGQHSKKSWAKLVSRIEVETHPTRERAKKAEAWAIMTELPIFNERLQGDLPYSNAEIGRLIGFTLEEAYALARKGEPVHTIDPVEYGGMSKQERRHHQRVMNRLARDARRKHPLA